MTRYLDRGRARLLDYSELTDDERDDYPDPEYGAAEFFRFRGVLYCLDEMIRTDGDSRWLAGTHISNSSGILVRAMSEDSVVVAIVE